MKILQIHNEYQQRGGEDTVVELEKKLLSTTHDVYQFTRSNNDIKTLWDKWRLLLDTHYSKRSYRQISDKLDEVKPDVVHVHNFFPLISPSVFYACKEKNIPTVLTLHNYRLIDPSALLYNNGRVDERSVTGSAYNLITDRVYRGSVLQTAIVAHMIEYHRRQKTWETVPDIFIALTNFAKSKFVQGGIPSDKLIVKANFIEDHYSESAVRKSFVYVGRLSKEKGIENLLKAWEHLPEDLYIIGDGPQGNCVFEVASRNHHIHYLGKLSRDKTLSKIQESIGLIFPSEWYEGFPMTLVEAMSVGTPIISSNIGSQDEIVQEGVSGIKFQAGDSKDLIKKVKRLSSDSALQVELSEGAREQYLRLYTPSQNLKELEGIYERAIEKCKSQV